MKLETKSDVAAALWVVLGAIIESKSNTLLLGIPNGHLGIPNGHLYAQLMNEFDIEQWTKLVALMKDSGLVTETNHLLQSTPKGEALWKQLDQIYAEAKQKQETGNQKEKATK